MTTLNRSVEARKATAGARLRDYPAGGQRFDLVVALLTLWFTVGLYVDGWAHNNGYVDNTFFTPWHALLYSGMAATGLFLIVTQYRNVGRGHTWARALPKGYLVSLLAVVLFFLGGGFDFIWHTLFGFEANVEALLSPAHLLLATSAVLITTGPLRAAWARPGRVVGWRRFLPAWISLLILLSLLTFFTQYANLFANSRFFDSQRVQSYLWDVTGIAYFVMTVGTAMFVLLYALRRWQLPPGAATLLLVGNAAAMFAIRFADQRTFAPTLLGALAAGLVADALIYKLRPSVERPAALRWFGFLVPLALSGVTMGVLLLMARVDWSIHMWLGVVFTAAIIGLGMTFLVAPAPFPAESE